MYIFATYKKSLIMENEFKGTKGEWKYEVKYRKNTTSITVQIPVRNDWNRELVLGMINREDDCTVASCCCSEEHANAKLIACAPEMLEQLKILYSFYEELAMKINSDDFDEEFRGKWNPIMNNTECIINKATKL